MISVTIFEIFGGIWGFSIARSGTRPRPSRILPCGWLGPFHHLVPKLCLGTPALKLRFARATGRAGGESRRLSGCPNRLPAVI